jgi:NAD-dependent deacetylase
MVEGRIDIGKYRNIVVLTGAGISVASGIRTYRGPEGLWNDRTLVRLSDAATFRSDPLEVWKFWSESRRMSAAAEPNAAHRALAELEARLRPDQAFTLITQNIDGLHRRAGSRRVIEYHGSVGRTRCSNEGCATPPYEDDGLYPDAVPTCPRCGANLRPDIVLFHEMIPEANATAALEALRSCDLFLAVGTSGTVYPANEFVRWAGRAGARTVFVNLEPLEEDGGFFDETHLGKAEEILPILLGAGAAP